MRILCINKHMYIFFLNLFASPCRLCVFNEDELWIFLNDFYELPCVDINGRWGLYNTIYITYEIPNLSLDFQMISRYVVENF